MPDRGLLKPLGVSIRPQSSTSMGQESVAATYQRKHHLAGENTPRIMVHAYVMAVTDGWVQITHRRCCEVS